MTKQSQIQIVVLLSAGHSGSTLLGLLLGGHSKLFSVGEMNQLDKKSIPCSNGTLPTDDSLWKGITPLITAPLRVNRYTKDLLFNRQYFYEKTSGRKVDVIAVADMYYNICSRLLQKTGAKRLVWAPTNAEDLLPILNVDKRFSLKVIHLVRDGRGVANSYARKRGSRIYHMWRWVKGNLKYSLLIRRLGVPTWIVRYEDLAQAPEHTLQSICEMMNVTYEPEMLDFANSDHRQVGGNRMRLKNSSEIRLDEKWRSELRWYEWIVFALLGYWLWAIYKLRAIKINR